MKCTNATKFHRKSGVAKWRDLQFYGPVLEMFFSSRKQCAGPCSCESSALENDLCLYLFGRLFCAGVFLASMLCDRLGAARSSN
jgi:hypothetical protein